MNKFSAANPISHGKSIPISGSIAKAVSEPISEQISDHILSIHDLSFTYTNLPAVDHVSLSVQKGEVFSLIGPNGCGKSTLLRLAAGLIDQKYEKNKIELAQCSLNSYDRKTLAKTIAFLPQSRNIPDISVKRLVEHGRFPYLDLGRHLTAKDQNMITHALRIMHLQEMSDLTLPNLSGGERQRTYIALAIAQDTPLLFLDEPTTYLDIHYQFELLDTIQMLNQQYSKTIVMVLHDLTLALKYSDRIAVMDHGKLVFTGTPSSLIKTNVLEQVFHVSCTSVSINNNTEYIIRKKDDCPES